MTDPEAIADQVLPLDGPYTPERVRAAADLLSALVRRLNHATLGWSQDQSLPMPQDIDRVVSSLHAGVSGMRQLCNQLAERTRREPLDRLGVDDHGDGIDAVAASTFVARHLDEAAGHCGVVSGSLGSAQSVTSRLYVRDPS